MEKAQNIIAIIGTTASGKTKLAAKLAKQFDAEIISADSRQVYRGMDIGTGKDLDEYNIEGHKIAYHLIDIVDPTEEYNVYRYKTDFARALDEISSRNKRTIICGGSGMYVDAIVRNYSLESTPVDNDLRNRLQGYSLEQLVDELKSMKAVHNITDITDRERCIRAIEIERGKKNKVIPNNQIQFDIRVFGVKFDRQQTRSRITDRLKQRLENGLVEEVEGLLPLVGPEKLMFFGLEYRYLTSYIIGQISYDEMFSKLNTAIHQFAKRQDTYWRFMEKNGVKITWSDGNMSLDQKVELLYEVSGC